MSITRFAGSERSPVVKSDQTSNCLFFPAWKLQKYCDGFYDSIGQQPWSRNVKIWPAHSSIGTLWEFCVTRGTFGPFRFPAWLKIDGNSYCSMHMDSSVTYDQWGLWVPNWLRMLKFAWTFHQENLIHRILHIGVAMVFQDATVKFWLRIVTITSSTYDGGGPAVSVFCSFYRAKLANIETSEITIVLHEPLRITLSSSYKLNIRFFYFKLMSWQSSFVL